MTNFYESEGYSKIENMLRNKFNRPKLQLTKLVSNKDILALK